MTSRVQLCVSASLILASLLLAACGEDRFNTAPRISQVEEAPVVTADQLSADYPDAFASTPMSADNQGACERELRRNSSNVIGTATSVYRGKSVVLALTTREVRGLPSIVNGTDIVQYVVGDVRAQTYYCGTSTSRADECAAGTLGAIVSDGIRNYWLSNWHVFAGNRAMTGDVIDSPGRLDVACGTAPSVGALSRWVPVRFDGSTNTVDCAIGRITTGSVSPIQSAGSNSFLPSDQIAAPVVGLAVKKVGRSTHFTSGSIVGVNATLTVTYSQGSARFGGCVIMTHMSQAGDSGSLVCASSNNRPVALLFAGSSTTTVGCPISPVLQSLGVHIVRQ